MSSTLPPGLLYVIQTVPKLGLPLLPIYIAHCYLSYSLSTYVWTLAYVLAVPSFLVLRGILQYLQEEAEIKRLGARRVSQVPTHWPGGIDALLKTVRGFSKGYIGAASSPRRLKLRNLMVCTSPADPWEEFSLTQGPTYNLRLFWQDMVRRVN